MPDRHLLCRSLPAARESDFEVSSDNDDDQWEYCDRSAAYPPLSVLSQEEFEKLVAKREKLIVELAMSGNNHLNFKALIQLLVGQNSSCTTEYPLADGDAKDGNAADGNTADGNTEYRNAAMNGLRQMGKRLRFDILECFFLFLMISLPH